MAFAGILLVLILDFAAPIEDESDAEDEFTIATAEIVLAPQSPDKLS